jgi:hypothetical protein
MAKTIRAVAQQRQARERGELAAHVLEVMHTRLQSVQDERHVEVSSRSAPPAPLPVDLVRLLKTSFFKRFSKRRETSIS